METRLAIRVCHRVSRATLSPTTTELRTCSNISSTWTYPAIWTKLSRNQIISAHNFQRNAFSTSSPKQQPRERPDPVRNENLLESSYSQPATDLSQKVTEEEHDHFRVIEAESKEQQRKSPWTREGSELPPVARNRSASAMTKGKLLTTPSRMLKLILPLTTRDVNKDRKDIEPLALLVHPQQPLSYLERLIQSELPVLEQTGKAPHIAFRAEDNSEEDAMEDEQPSGKKDAEETRADSHTSRTGQTNASEAEREGAEKNQTSPSEPIKSDDSVYDPEHPNFIRWSPSTEMGDFIRDAARGKEFAIDIEGAAKPIYIGVPSFTDRTYYLRTRLRKTARQISRLVDVKRECDKLAHRGAKRVAQLGFGGLLGWWAVVYWLTFRTSLGWDVMEPVTYLVGLTGLIGGYMWFLYHNREVSYKSAMNVTISRRQGRLYELKGFDLAHWEGLVEEGNRLRREIMMIADEYDVEWDESKDEGDAKVKEVLRRGRRKNGKDGKKKKDDDEDEEDD